MFFSRRQKNEIQPGETKTPVSVKDDTPSLTPEQSSPVVFIPVTERPSTFPDQTANSLTTPKVSPGLSGSNQSRHFDLNQTTAKTSGLNGVSPLPSNKLGTGISDNSTLSRSLSAGRTGTSGSSTSLSSSYRSPYNGGTTPTDGRRNVDYRVTSEKASPAGYGSQNKISGVTASGRYGAEPAVKNRDELKRGTRRDPVKSRGGTKSYSEANSGSFTLLMIKTLLVVLLIFIVVWALYGVSMERNQEFWESVFQMKFNTVMDSMLPGYLQHQITN